MPRRGGLRARWDVSSSPPVCGSAKPVTTRPVIFEKASLVSALDGTAHPREELDDEVADDADARRLLNIVVRHEMHRATVETEGRHSLESRLGIAEQAGHRAQAEPGRCGTDQRLRVVCPKSN